MPTVPEYIFYTLVNILPLLFLALLPFRDCLRLPVRWVAALALCLCAIDGLTIWVARNFGSAGMFSVLSIFLYLAFYLLAVRARPLQLLAVLLILMNFASVATVTAGFLLSSTRIQLLDYPYSWGYTLYYLAGLMLPFPLYYQTLNRRIRPQVQLEQNNRVWRYLWVVPAVFCTLCYYNLFTAESVWVFSQSVGNLLFVWVVGLGNLLTLYLLAWLLEEGRENLRLQQQNDQLTLQTVQYEALQRSIEETRRARHDLRQHLTALQGYVENEDLAGAAQYLAAFGESLPSNLQYSYCKNYAVNAVLLYYREKAQQAGVLLEISARMEEHTIIPETEFCVLLGSLLENAVESCAPLAGERWIRASIRQTGESMLSLTVDNTSPTPPAEEGGGLRSSKHPGLGIGTQSVRDIAARYHGDARFSWRDGVFYASVMLNPWPENAG